MVRKFIISLAVILGLSVISLPLLAQSGSIDNTFNTNGNPSAIINDVELLDDGKYLVAVDTFNNTTFKFVRLLPNGTIDNSFPNTCTFWNGSVNQIKATADGKYLVAGDFNFQTTTGFRQDLLRFFADGTLDTSFFNVSTNAGISDIAVQADGKILVAGTFTTFNGTQHNRLVRLNANGTLDIGFNQNLGTGLSYAAEHKLAIDINGKITILGSATFNGQPIPGFILRLNTDGTRDVSFSATPTNNGGISGFTDFEYTADNKIIVVGSFDQVNGISNNDIARLNYDGSVDATFSSGNGPSCCGISWVRIDPTSGKYIISEGFYNYNNVPRANIARINTDGSLDLTFDPGLGFIDGQYNHSSLDVDNEGKIIVGGQFSSYNGNYRKNLVRINGGEIVAPVDISIIGTATESGSFSIDYQMSSTDGITYVRTDLLLAGDPNISNPETKVKFRQNYDWAVNWGGSTFPSGTGTQDGPDIPITTPGFYTVSLNIQTGTYNFTLTGPPPSIGMIGTALNGWTTDVFMEPVDGKNYIAYGVNLSAGEMKFRQDGSWTTNWGAVSFPQGIGFQDGPNIVVPGGVYSVSFNRKTGAYSFDVTVGEKHEIDLSKTVLAPQPCNQTLNILGLPDGTYTYTILDAKGILIETGALNSTSLNVDRLRSGIYVIQLFDDAGRSIIRRFITSK